MRDHLHLFMFLFCFSTGCIVSDVDHTIDITGYTGASVVLPCSCPDSQSTDTTFTWEFQRGNRWIQVSEDEKYSGRLVLFNEHSPTNLSLLISDLRINDQGYYKCTTQTNSVTFVELKVKGCDLVKYSRTLVVTGYSGESVVLLCSCSELLAKPQQIKWVYFINNEYEEIYPNEQIENFKNRVKLLNPNTPGDLSLHISALTSKDQGHYQCVSSQQVNSFSLKVLHDEATHQTSHQTQDFTTSQLLPTPQPYTSQRSRNNKKVTADDVELKRENNQDDVMYSAVVHVKAASTPAHDVPAEHTEYASINIKR
ncbi:polymeric immunoglobulin receptor-like isoform X2 [Puntigrus tetrazona]|uniref:polymeric immunoglobulin receptor-like isoform X2 n=1 Tax=Puntigrus tetrazona TaxID=1606681 RepID=UPI001C890749|nr:polymeric immunoglobulin receptor-like isoform X2 [Puntigrus tetrazona]